MTETTSELDRQVVAAIPQLATTAGHRRRTLIRATRRSAMRKIAAGKTDADQIAAEVMEDLKADPAASAILTIIAIAVLSGLVQWIVKRLLDNWFAEGST